MQQTTVPNLRQYRLGIALSGGGARGFAHIGALKAIEEAGLKPDIIAGVSAGSIAGSLYAAGIKLDDILPLFAHLGLTDFLSFPLRRGAGIFTLHKLARFIEKNTGFTRLEDLPTRLIIGATDFDHAVPACFTKGPLGRCVEASCSIPIVFAPVEIGGVHYVDGGVMRNLPAWTIRERCQTLIGINCSPMVSAHYKDSTIDMALRTFHIMARSNQNMDMQLCDLVIRTPELQNYQVFNLKDINKAYLSGYAAAHRAIRQWLNAGDNVSANHQTPQTGNGEHTNTNS